MISNTFSTTMDGSTVTYLQVDSSDWETASVTLDGTWSGDALFYATIDDVNYPVWGVQDAQNGNYLTSVNANGNFFNNAYQANVRGITGFGVYTSAWVSGTCSVQIKLHRAAK